MFIRKMFKLTHHWYPTFCLFGKTWMYQSKKKKLVQNTKLKNLFKIQTCVNKIYNNYSYFVLFYLKKKQLNNIWKVSNKNIKYKKLKPTKKPCTKNETGKLTMYKQDSMCKMSVASMNICHWGMKCSLNKSSVVF